MIGENNTDFLYTLEKYMENNYSVVQTAEELFIHRNTMTGRLNKITELLNMDWQDARKCQMLGLVLISENCWRGGKAMKDEATGRLDP